MSSFFDRSGNYIMIASISARILSFFASWIALQIIPNQKLGIVIYAFQIILFISAFASMGLNQGLIRYGSFLKSIEDKNKLFSYVLKYGLIITSIFTLITIVFSFIIKFQTPEVSFYLRLLSLMFTTQFLLEILQIQFRLQKKNKTFAYVEISYNLFLVILVFILSYFFKEFGYAIALILTPLLTFFVFIRNIDFKWSHKPNLTFINYSFWRYGLFASLSNLTTILLVSIDILLIGQILSDMKMVTIFKYLSLIPFSILFLSRAFMSIDFIVFTEKIANKKFIYNYIKNYLVLFSTVSIVFLATILFFGKLFLEIFDSTYISYFSTLVVLSFGVTGVLTLRGLFDNLLSSIGKSHVSFIIFLTALTLNVFLNYYLIPIYGILGAAITSAFLMWFSGFLCMGFFFYHYNNYLSKK